VTGFGLVFIVLLTAAMFYFSFSETGYQMLVQWVDKALGNVDYFWNALISQW
jgi:hypothetical protein